MPASTEQRPNVIYISVDALRTDRCSLHGYSRPTTPNLGKMARDGLACDNAFSISAFTQAACISMLTSSLPLSYGGWDNGAAGRPPTVFKVFSDSGYHVTTITVSPHITRYYGYGQGVDDEHQILSLITMPGSATMLIRNTLVAYDKGDLDEEKMLGRLMPIMTKFFDDALDFAIDQKEYEPELMRDFPHSPMANAGYDFKKIHQSLKSHRAEFKSDPVAYIRGHLMPVPKGREWMNVWLPGEWRYRRKFSKLAKEALFRFSNKVGHFFRLAWATDRQYRHKIYPDAHSLADKVIAQIKKRPADQPFFIWTHLVDTHTPYITGHGPKWYKQTPDRLKKLGHSPELNPFCAFKGRPDTDEEWAAYSALYDAAIHNTDEQIGRVVTAVEEMGLAENTIIVVCGDHGEEFGEHGDYGHHFRLYNHNMAIPILFHRSGMAAQRIPHFVTTMDIPPTLADMAGIPPHPAWKGRSVLDAAIKERGHIVMETFHGGNCIFEHRPLYFGVRNQTFHYLWRERIDPEDRFSPDGPELFDNAKDHDQQNNLYHPDHPAVAGFNAIIAERMADISEISDQRIIDAFGEIGADAIRQKRLAI